MANMPVFYDTLYFKLLLTTRLKNYWSRIELSSYSPRIIITLQERHMEYNGARYEIYID